MPSQSAIELNIWIRWDLEIVSPNDCAHYIRPWGDFKSLIVAKKYERKKKTMRTGTQWVLSRIFGSTCKYVHL